MLKASKIAFAKLREKTPLIASLATFSIVASITRGAPIAAAFGRLIPLIFLCVAFFIYQTIKANRKLSGKARLSRRQLFFRFYSAIFALFVSYFIFSISWEVNGNGVEAFGMLLPVLLFCVVLCAVALYRELSDLPDDFEGNL